MPWWNRFFDKSHTAQVLFQVFTKDAERGAEVRLRSDGKYYFAPLEHVQGTEFKTIPSQISFYASEAEAEAAAVNSPWFLHGERPKP